MRVEGGCHCGAVRFAAEVEEPLRLLDCNCSICRKTGFLHLIVPREDLDLLAGGNVLTSYRFGSGQAEHLFCATCGIKSFYQPRSHPEAWSVNFRCLDKTEEFATEIVNFDGRNWERARAGLADN